jgi:hypothetical protein
MGFSRIFIPRFQQGQDLRTTGITIHALADVGSALKVIS